MFVNKNGQAKVHKLADLYEDAQFAPSGDYYAEASRFHLHMAMGERQEKFGCRHGNWHAGG